MTAETPPTDAKPPATTPPFQSSESTRNNATTTAGGGMNISDAGNSQDPVAGFRSQEYDNIRHRSPSPISGDPVVDFPPSSSDTPMSDEPAHSRSQDSADDVGGDFKSSGSVGGLDDKERARVSIACLTCRSRKIRCDGQKPTCSNCLRRNNDCSYDTVPKRRGPDKIPGARQRARAARLSAAGHPPYGSKPVNLKSDTEAGHQSASSYSQASSSSNPKPPSRRGSRSTLSSKKATPEAPSIHDIGHAFPPTAPPALAPITVSIPDTHIHPHRSVPPSPHPFHASTPPFPAPAGSSHYMNATPPPSASVSSTPSPYLKRTSLSSLPHSQHLQSHSHSESQSSFYNHTNNAFPPTTQMLPPPIITQASTSASSNSNNGPDAYVRRGSDLPSHHHHPHHSSSSSRSSPSPFDPYRPHSSTSGTVANGPGPVPSVPAYRHFDPSTTTPPLTPYSPQAPDSLTYPQHRYSEPFPPTGNEQTYNSYPYPHTGGTGSNLGGGYLQ